MVNTRSWTADAPLVIAHRGASLRAPENTMAAFQLAVELGSDGIELDVKLTRDEQIVIHHDSTLDRTTNGSGNLKDFSLSELKELDAGGSFDVAFSGETIPTILELLDEVGDQILLNIELTNYDAPFDSLPEKVLSVLDLVKLHDTILLSSFNPLALCRIKRLNREMRTALLVAPQIPGWAQALLKKFTPYTDYHPHMKLVTRTIVEAVHRSHGRLNTWTVNEHEEMLSLLRIGVDGIITDDVETAIGARMEFLQ
jgi:glycerophosphoryl diester phosphodiesterase